MLWTRVPASRPRLQPSPDRRKLFRETNQLGVMAESLPFEDVELAERAIGEPILHVDVAGFEGPLDLLLDLAGPPAATRSCMSAATASKARSTSCLSPPAGRRSPSTASRSWRSPSSTSSS